MFWEESTILKNERKGLISSVELVSTELVSKSPLRVQAVSAFVVVIRDYIIFVQRL